MAGKRTMFGVQMAKSARPRLAGRCCGCGAPELESSLEPTPFIPRPRTMRLARPTEPEGSAVRLPLCAACLERVHAGSSRAAWKVGLAAAAAGALTSGAAVALAGWPAWAVVPAHFAMTLSYLVVISAALGGRLSRMRMRTIVIERGGEWAYLFETRREAEEFARLNESAAGEEEWE